MDLNAKKEQYSVAYVRALAAVGGMTAAKPEPDIDSEDLILSDPKHRGPKIRSPKFAVQLKCTAKLQRNKDGRLAFPLDIKNYDDLRPTDLSVPRILVVVEVPDGDDPEAWIDHRDDSLTLFHTAYWVSIRGYKAVANDTKVTVHLPESQRLTTPALREIVVKLGEGTSL